MAVNLPEVLEIFTESWKFSNTYYLNLAGGIIIDPGKPRPEDFSKPVSKIFATHGHYDHLMGIDTWSGDSQKFYYPKEDLWMLNDVDANASKMFANARSFPEPEVAFEDQDCIQLDDNLFFKVYVTPGHTWGSSCLLLMEGPDASDATPVVFFTGDTVFDNSVGRSDLLGGDPHAMAESVIRLKKLFHQLPADLVMLSGHGAATNIDRVMKFNPFFREGGIKL